MRTRTRMIEFDKEVIGMAEYFSKDAFKAKRYEITDGYFDITSDGVWFDGNMVIDCYNFDLKGVTGKWIMPNMDYMLGKGGE